MAVHQTSTESDTRALSATLDVLRSRLNNELKILAKLREEYDDGKCSKISNVPVSG